MRVVNQERADANLEEVFQSLELGFWAGLAKTELSNSKNINTETGGLPHHTPQQCFPPRAFVCFECEGRAWRGYQLE